MPSYFPILSLLSEWDLDTNILLQHLFRQLVFGPCLTYLAVSGIPVSLHPKWNQRFLFYFSASVSSSSSLSTVTACQVTEGMSRQYVIRYVSIAFFVLHGKILKYFMRNNKINADDNTLVRTWSTYIIPNFIRSDFYCKQ